MQAAYGIHVADIVYTRGIREQNEIVKSIRQKYRRVTENWIRFVRFVVSEINVTVLEKRKHD